MDNLKKLAAMEALRSIEPGWTVGFGAGSTIRLLIALFNEEPELARSISTVTSSFSTKLELLRAGFKVEEVWLRDRIDIYFDGCDQFDRDLNALKSGGGIHTREKILASMAREFVLLGDESKVVEQLDGKYPLVVEVVPDALQFVINRLHQLYDRAVASIRMAEKKDGAVITENGNYLVDCVIRPFPDPAHVNTAVKMIPGVVEHSLFYALASKAIVGGPGGVRVW